MASRRDLVEAHAFNRRRLVTAFLGGAPGGRELEPHRPARAVIAGIVLAGLLLAGAAVAGFLRPGLPNGWNNNTLVIAKDSGARYVATGGRLFPVANTTSARLLLPASDFRVVLAPDDRIAREPRGDNLGIIGAPDTLPNPDDLVASGWTSCLDGSGRTRLRIARRPGAVPTAGDAALVVQVGPDVEVLAAGRRYAVPTASRTVVLRALGLDAVAPVKAPPGWAELFPQGPDLVPVFVPGAGKPAPPGLAVPAGAGRIGTVLQVTDAAGTQRPYLLASEGLVPMNPVAAALYGIGGGQGAAPVRVGQAAVAALPTVSATSVFPSAWPSELPTPLPGPVRCALLGTDVEGHPTVSFAAPTDPAVVPAGQDEAVVDPAAGALVRSAAGGVTNRGTVYLIDSAGRRYALGGDPTETQARLGYGAVGPAPIPPAWLEPLRDGPVLSPQAAQAVVGAGLGTGTS